MNTIESLTDRTQTQPINMNGVTYTTEKEIAEVFDQLIAACKDFYVVPEVEGYYTQPKPFADERTPRIDRLLIPKPSLRLRDWPYFTIGIELKAAHQKLGPALSQAMDYTRAVFTVPEFGCDITPRFVFVFNTNKTYGPLLSVATQNRVGFARLHPYDNQLHFYLGEQSAFWCDGDRLNFKTVNCGYKTGSR